MLIRGRTSRLPGHKETRFVRGSVDLRTNTNFTCFEFLPSQSRRYVQCEFKGRSCLSALKRGTTLSPHQSSMRNHSESTPVIDEENISYKLYFFLIRKFLQPSVQKRRCCRGVLIRGRTSRLPGHKEARFVRGSVDLRTNTNFTCFEFLSSQSRRYVQCEFKGRSCLSALKRETTLSPPQSSMKNTSPTKIPSF